MPDAELKRNLNLPLLIFYGIGTILGAGIYALVGKVAGFAELFTPMAFLLSAVIATFTAVTYAELSANFPKSAGEAIYIFEAFKKPALGTLIGLLVILTGIVSSATLTKSFVGYLNVFMPCPPTMGMFITAIILCLIAIWGILPSVRIIAVITSIEILGLIYIIISAFVYHPFQNTIHYIPSSADALMGIVMGAFVAFYAFIGFEDMVNVAEEVKQPETTLPKAIFIALILATLLYMAVSAVAILAVDVNDLKTSAAPMTLLVDQSSQHAKYLISLISLIAISNGALVQIIMASRVLYGIAKHFNFIAVFAQVHPKTNTPILATILISLLIFVFATSLPLVQLAQGTSLIILIIFALMHLSLIKLKVNQAVKAELGFPFLLPVIGLVLISGFLAVNLYQLLIN